MTCLFSYLNFKLNHDDKKNIRLNQLDHLYYIIEIMNIID